MPEALQAEGEVNDRPPERPWIKTGDVRGGRMDATLFSEFEKFFRARSDGWPKPIVTRTINCLWRFSYDKSNFKDVDIEAMLCCPNFGNRSARLCVHVLETMGEDHLINFCTKCGQELKK